MRVFTTHSGLVAAMDRANVDTDQIIPKQFLKRIERTGFGEFLFFDWRFLEDGSDDPGFELNQAKFKGASVLVARRNFGCGSSREHAVWALNDYGFRVVIAPSFADIFYNNCFKNSVLPIVLDESLVEDIFQRTQTHPGYELKVDLEQCELSDDHGLKCLFEVNAPRRHSLLQGLDDIALTLQHEDKITAYERNSEFGIRNSE
jgi:3-isopropylmalate/(R)-2-methylmalate dehydratase small subunit